jgi:DNA replication protein DnaC
MLPVRKIEQRPLGRQPVAIVKNPLKTEWQRRWLRMEVTHPKIQELADAIAEFAKSFFFNATCRNLVLVGNSGCGKTHAAKRLRAWATVNAAAAFDTRLWDKKGAYPEALFVSWPEVTEGYYAGRFDVTHEFFQTDLLFLDDIGAERDPKQLATDKLCQILSKREKRFTVITTNIQPEHWLTRWDERIADRLLRNTLVVDLTAVPSYATL